MKKPTPEKSKLAPIVLPAQPWLERLPHKGCPIIVMTDHGRKVISILAAAGASQALISARLGMHLRTFKDLMARDETVRIAWESGIAEEEFLLVRHLRAQAENGAFVPGLWLLKTRHNYVEGAAPASTAPNIVINLPGSLTPAQYLETLKEIPPLAIEDKS